MNANGTKRTRPAGVFKKTNTYSRLLPWYADAPKAVFAALAFSLAMRLSEDDAREAERLLVREWGALHAGGIVPQRCPSSAAKAEGGQS